MSSINKLVPAAFNNTVEIAPALANLNFDFSLWKVEAPKEFDGVGSALSSLRRNEAENGGPHITARKLGALFETMLPPIPHLTKAYGQRASEISQASSLSPQARKGNGVFSGQAGSDATSIWAAATSGPAAIAVHLLACLLARCWDGPEATSIWVEIVQRRQDSVKALLAEGNIVERTTVEAVRQTISRAQVAEWDASARSWLRTADQIKARQHKQLMLILDNVKLPVNSLSDTFESVTSAWSNSMVQMEGLIEGIAQQANRGDVLLAVSAWHLFPDLMVAFPSNTHVHQHDPLFASGGVLTIGLEVPDSQKRGLSWSLPLARLRHYGSPVVSSSYVKSDERLRVNLKEFLFAILGCFLEGWGEAAANTMDALQWLTQLSNILDHAANAGSADATALTLGEAQYSWLNLLFTAAREYTTLTGNERLLAKKLVSLGRRHGKSFLGLPKWPLLGLIYRGKYIGLIHGEEERIEALRKIAHKVQKELRLTPNQIFIRYAHQVIGSNKIEYEFASALPRANGPVKRKADGTEAHVLVHDRWLYAGTRELHGDKTVDKRYEERMEETFRTGTSERYRPSHSTHLDMKVETYGEQQMRYHTAAEVQRLVELNVDYLDEADLEIIRYDFLSRSCLLASTHEHIHRREDAAVEDLHVQRLGIFWDNMASRQSPNSHHVKSSNPWYRQMYGDVNSAALFILEGQENLVDLFHPSNLDAPELYSLFANKKVAPDAVVKHMAETLRSANPDADPHLQGAKGISTVANLYKEFPEATIDIRVLQHQLYRSHWIAEGLAERGLNSNIMTSMRGTPACLLPYKLDQPSAFACIAMFESGQYNPRPSELGDVMAMSSGNSIYAGAALLYDPSPMVYSGGVRRVIGNIGRPGIAFLIPPRDPLMKEVKIGEWEHINREDFDGKLRNSFEGTSLHLSFTGAHTPINLNFSGAQDDDVYMLETLISVYDKGRWMADLNIPRTFASSELKLIPSCSHTTLQQRWFPNGMTCIDNWYELLEDTDEKYVFVQTRGNWEARIAAASIGIAKACRTCVLPSDRLCWLCTLLYLNNDTPPRTMKVVIA